MIIFDNAVYFEKDSVVTVSSDELADTPTLMKVKSKELWESKHKNYRIFPYMHEWEWKFASLTGSYRATDRYKKNTADMNQYAESLKNELNTNIYTFMSSLRDQCSVPSTVTFLNSAGYAWESNVRRDLSYTERIEHDVFGYFPSFETAERSPFVGIELIGKEYPNDNVLRGMMEATAAMPYFIFFEFMEAQNCLFKLDKAIRIIKPTYFVYDGYLWKNCRRLDVSDRQFKQMVAEDLAKFA